MTTLLSSLGPTGAPSHGMPGSLSIMAFSAASLSASAVSSSPALRSRRLGLGAQRGPLLGRGGLEPRADRIALGPQRLDLALRGAHFGVEREQRIEVEIDPFGGNRLARPRRGSP